MCDKVWVEDELVRDDEPSGDKQLVGGVVPDVIQTVHPGEHHRGETLQRHQGWDLTPHTHTHTHTHTQEATIQNTLPTTLEFQVQLRPTKQYKSGQTLL